MTGSLSLRNLVVLLLMVCVNLLAVDEAQSGRRLGLYGQSYSYRSRYSPNYQSRSSYYRSPGRYSRAFAYRPSYYGYGFYRPSYNNFPYYRSPGYYGRAYAYGSGYYGSRFYQPSYYGFSYYQPYGISWSLYRPNVYGYSVAAPAYNYYPVTHQPVTINYCPATFQVECSPRGPVTSYYHSYSYGSASCAP